MLKNFFIITVLAAPRHSVKEKYSSYQNNNFNCCIDKEKVFNNIIRNPKNEIIEKIITLIKSLIPIESGPDSANMGHILGHFQHRYTYNMESLKSLNYLH